MNYNLTVPMTKRWRDLAVLTDFDGTVAELVTDPKDAKPVSEAIEGLRRLSACVGLVGVVSGRPSEFLKQCLPEDLFLSALVVGSYGEQIVLPGATEVEVVSQDKVGAPGGEAALAKGFRWVQKHLNSEGVELEDKPYSFTIHYRRAPDKRYVVEELRDQLEDEFGLISLVAKQAIEFFEGRRPSKVLPIKRFVQNYDFVVYLGDDVSDVEVFEYLHSSDTQRSASLKIAVSSNEAPEDLNKLSDLSLDSPQEAGRWLTKLSSVLACNDR